jgi:hypothetical protein
MGGWNGRFGGNRLDRVVGSGFGLDWMVGFSRKLVVVVGGEWMGGGWGVDCNVMDGWRMDGGREESG